MTTQKTTQTTSEETREEREQREEIELRIAVMMFRENQDAMVFADTLMALVAMGNKAAQKYTEELISLSRSSGWNDRKPIDNYDQTHRIQRTD